MAEAKKTIFLVEDEADIMYIYKMALVAAGFNVVGINNGKEAIEKLKDVQDKKDKKPDLVLLDLILPDINGLEILRMIRENAITKNVKVFILSNYTSESLVNINYIKPDKFLLKAGMTPTQLVDMIKEELK